MCSTLHTARENLPKISGPFNSNFSSHWGESTNWVGEIVKHMSQGED